MVWYTFGQAIPLLIITLAILLIFRREIAYLLGQLVAALHRSYRGIVNAYIEGKQSIWQDTVPQKEELQEQKQE